MTVFKKMILCAFMAVAFVTAATIPSHAISDAEKQLYAESANTPTNFLSPTQYREDIMAKATNLITDWGPFDSYKVVMRVSNTTPTLIQTYDPDEIDRIGFKVECSNHGGGQDEVDVSCISFAGNIFTMGREYKDAVKRARMLSYLLQVYAVSLIKADQGSTPPAAQASTTAPPPDSNEAVIAAIPPDMKLYLELIATQISNKNFDGALTSVDALKNNIIKVMSDSAASTATDGSQSAPSTSSASAAPAPKPEGTNVTAPPPSTGPILMQFKLKTGEVVTGVITSHDSKAKATYIDTGNGPRTLNDADILSSAPAVTD